MSGLSYSRGPDAPILEHTIGAALAGVACRFPDRDALIARHQGVRLSWRELDGEVTRVARGLAGLGLAPQDRVGIWSANCAEWVLLQLACARAGFVLVNVNPACRSHDLGFVLQKSRMRVLALWEKDARANYAAILEDATAGRNLALERVLYLGSEGWAAMLANGRELPRRPVLPGDPANIQYTSGTTGTPKGVVLTHRNLVNNAWLIGLWLGVGDRDRVCNPCPLYHCAGSVVCGLTALLRGAALILPSAQFDARALLEAVAAERATFVGGVPTMYIAALEDPECARFDLGSLRIAWMGGAPCPPELLRRLKDRLPGCRPVVLYGQTESSPVITISPPEDGFEQLIGNVGRVIHNTEVKICDPATGETLPIGVTGELCVRGYLVMAGYDDEPEATARAIDAGGWLRTGDLAVLGEDGRVQITGRAKDMIIRGGENVYPREIEEFLYTHPKIADVSVVGLPDRRLGEVVLAWVRLAAGESATEEEIRGFCQGRIAHFKIPQHIRFVESFPTTISGKVQKFRIRQMELQARGLDPPAGERDSRAGATNDAS